MNKSFIKSAISGTTAIILFGLLFCSCSKKDSASLNASVPVPSFTYSVLTPSSDANPQNLLLVNTSSDAMTGYWRVSDEDGNTIGTYTGDSVKLALVFAGNYTVRMAAGGPGGISDTVQQSVTIDQDNQFAVSPQSLLGIITGAGFNMTQRTWMAERVLNSVIVWDTYQNCLNQIDGGGGAYWSFGPGEIATDGSGRDGYLDDKYTFVFSNASQFDFDDNNTVFLDGGGSDWTKALPTPWNTTLGNVSSTELYNAVPPLKPWASGQFTYTISAAPAGAMNLGQITITGMGGHMGLQDKSNGGDLLTPTSTSVTYDILRVSTGLTDATTGKSYDQIILGVTEPGVVWTFMFRSDR